MKKLGRYDLIRVIGKGAMGMVYEARDPNLNRKVAIKTIKVENLTDEEAADYELRFRTEAHSAARLQHPNIVSVYDSDRDVDVAYLVIEFINGEDLKHHLDRGDVYTLGQTLAIMGDLLSALDYAHRNGIVHRDIKPANLLLEPSGRVKLADFGVARMQDSGDATRTQGSMVGTLKYMSPEQVQSHPVDARADLFAAAIVLYQLLTGVRPFDGSSDFDVIQKITSQNPAPPSSLTPGLPAALDSVVARALEKLRENRYPTAQAFSDAMFAAAQSGDADQTIAPRPKAQASRTPVAAAGEHTGGGSASGATSTVTQELELVYWKDITESTDHADFVGFLNRFPSGIYADLAKRKLKRLAVADDDITQTLVPITPVQVAATQDDVPTVPRPLAMSGPDTPAPPSLIPVSLVAQTPPELVGASRSGQRRLGIVAVVALVLAGILGYVLLPDAKEGDGPPVSASPASASAAQAVLVPIESPAPAQPAELSASVPMAVSAAVAMNPPASVAPASTVDKPVAIAPRSAQPASSASAATAPKLAASVPKLAASAPKLAASARQTAELPKGTEPLRALVVVPKAPVNTAPSGDPRAECKDRWLLAYQFCLSRKCGDAAFAQHPVCVERSEMERHNKSRDKTGL